MSYNSLEWVGNFKITSDSNISALHRKILLWKILFYTLVKDKELRILDIGCGYGTTMKYLASVGYKNLFGVDPDKNISMSIPREVGEIRIGSTEDLPYENCSFDIVVFNGVLHHLRNLDDYYSAFNEFNRILKPGGLVFIMEPGMPKTLKVLEFISAILGICSNLFRAWHEGLIKEKIEIEMFLKNHGIFRDEMIKNHYVILCDSYFIFSWVFSAKKT